MSGARGLAPLVAALVATSTNAPLRAQSLVMTSSYVQLAGEKIGEFVVGDLDGDGLDDLLLATEGDDLLARHLRIWLRRPSEPALAATADRSFPVPRDVVAFTLANLDGKPGAEIVLFSSTQVVGLSWPKDAERPTPFRIGLADLLWQPPNLPHTYWLDPGAADFDGDGRDDLLVPSANGFRAFRTQPDGEGSLNFTSFDLTLPPATKKNPADGLVQLRARAQSFELKVGRSSSRGVRSVLNLDDSVPIPAILDFDGDGDRDLAVVHDGRLMTWIWADGFKRLPQAPLTLPALGANLLNPSDSVQLADMDGDGRSDVVVVTAVASTDQLQSRVEVFLQGGDGSFAEKPADRLLLEGFVEIPRLNDVDGDGRIDLTIGSLDTDVVAALTSGGSGTLDAQLNVFRNDFVGARPRFGRPLALAERVAVSAKITRGRVRDRVLMNFVTDIDGNGTRDFVQRTDGVTLSVRPLRTAERRWSLGEPVWQTKVESSASVIARETAGRLVLWVVEDRQVLRLEAR
ncbi:MAG: FG-GAP repeat domain-containing protein [Planctomycetota bacterium]